MSEAERTDLKAASEPQSRKSRL